ncbi:hypothetical protein D3C76_323640 [compost metagenome]
MGNRIKPYYSVDKTIYFTDHVEEVIICTVERNDIADMICTLLNDAYKAAYEDGLNASLNDQYVDLNKKLMSLSIENTRLKKILNMTGQL